jgi:hypothetical protein
VKDTLPMSLMNLVRSLAVLVVGWTLVALGIGAMCGGRPPHAMSAPSLAEPSLHDALPLDSPVSKRYDLVDRSSGHRTPIRLPDGDQWTIVSVSPWRDPSGNLVAVGRWVNRDDNPFCGLGVFRISDSVVLTRVTTEILPTGRPCWIPVLPWTFLFPAGDGRLYRSRLPAPGDESETDSTTDGRASACSTIPVGWKAKPPGVGRIFLSDPIWSTEPKLRRFVIVGLSLQVELGPRPTLLPSQLWWLEMNEAADTILAAGPLTGQTGYAPPGKRHFEQFPNVAVGTEGAIHLVYLSRRDGENALSLHAARLDFDGASGPPRVVPGDRGSRILGGGLKKVPPLISADGSRVYALDRSGRVATFALTQDDGNSRH